MHRPSNVPAQHILGDPWVAAPGVQRHVWREPVAYQEAYTLPCDVYPYAPRFGEEVSTMFQAAFTRGVEDDDLLVGPVPRALNPHGITWGTGDT